MRSRDVVPLGPIALGVVEEFPVAVGFDFHPPTQFGVVGLGVDEPGVRVFGAGDVLGIDDVAVRVEYSVGSHQQGLPVVVMPNRVIRQ
jgi:hypothetical protein